MLKMNKMMVVGIILIVIGIVLVMSDTAIIMIHPTRLLGLIGLGMMVYRYVKIEYCEEEAE